MKNCNDFITKIALDEDVSVLDGSTDSAFSFQEFAELFQLIWLANASGAQGYRVAFSIALIQADDQFLLLWNQRILGIIFFFLKLIVGIGGIDHAKSLFPVLRHDLGVWLRNNSVLMNCFFLSCMAYEIKTWTHN